VFNFKNIPSDQRRIVVANLLKQKSESSLIEERVLSRKAQDIVDIVSWMRAAQGPDYFCNIYNESGPYKRDRGILYDMNSDGLIQTEILSRYA